MSVGRGDALVKHIASSKRRDRQRLAPFFGVHLVASATFAKRKRPVIIRFALIMTYPTRLIAIHGALTRLFLPRAAIFVIRQVSPAESACGVVDNRVHAWWHVVVVCSPNELSSWVHACIFEEKNTLDFDRVRLPDLPTFPIRAILSTTFWTYTIFGHFGVTVSSFLPFTPTSHTTISFSLGTF